MTTTTWPTQLMLPGQAAAPEGPADLSGMYLLHHAFRRDLAAFAAAAERTPVTDRDTWRRLADRWAYFARQLHQHHTAEDDHLWPLLLERADDADRAMLAAMAEEHEEIDPLLDSCADGFARLRASADETARSQLATQLRSAQAVLGHHLAHEETDAIAMIQRTMTGAEWDRMEKEKFAKGHSRRDMMALVPWAAYRLPAATMATLRPALPVPMRVLLALTEKGFAKREAAAFAYA